MPDVLKLGVVDTEVCPLASFLALHEPCVCENLEVMAYGRLAQSEWFRQVAAAHLTV